MDPLPVPRIDAENSLNRISIELLIKQCLICGKFMNLI